MFMNEDNTYSIKEVIVEFRADVSKEFSTLKERLDKIDNKQAIANGRTGSLEKRQWLQLGGFAVVCTIGALFVRLYIEDVVRNIVSEIRPQLTQDTSDAVVSKLELKYNIKIK